MSVGPAAARPMGLNSSAQSDLRNLAVDEEVCLTDTNHYCSFRQLAADHTQRIHVARGITLAIVHLEGRYTGYCLRATTPTKTYTYDSQAGGLSAVTRCKVTTSGRFGGVRRGPAWVA